MVSKTSKKAVPAKKKTNQVVDFEPNKMGFAIASLAAVILVLVGVIAMYA